MSQAKHVLESLTEKQREVLSLLAEGRTGKEIAHVLNISDSAVVQRIEKIRAKFDGASRLQLGRIWRDYTASDIPTDCKFFAGKSFQLPNKPELSEKGGRDTATTHFEFMDYAVFKADTPWSDDRGCQVVPEVLDGENATIFRWLYAVAAALGIACFLLVLLAVSLSVGQLV